MLELECQLIDFEKIVDKEGRRLLFFGRFAGLAGMIDTLWALGRRLEHEGVESPFSRVQPAYRYDDLDHAKREIAAVGDSIRRDGLPEAIRPMVCGFAGYGNVSHGAQEIYDLLPVREVAPEDLADVPPEPRDCYKVVFHETHMVERADGTSAFDLQEYYGHPERYRARFFPHLQHLTLLANCIYWEPKYPRFVTREQLSDLYGAKARPRLRVIGDITCDVNGSLECTVRATNPGDPVYVYEPHTGQVRDGVAGEGPVVLAVDFLPCELPVDSSLYFSRSLSPLIPGLSAAEFGTDLAASGLPPELTRATIVYHGQLTEPYRYLEQYVK
jgi:hypothetical protein